MSDFDDSVTQLFRHPDLAGAGAALRAEWREEEEEWMRAAAQHWAHGRDIHDVTRDLMHRGDTVEAIAAGRSFTGLVTFVGDDVMEVRTATGRVDVRLTVGDRRGPVAPLVLRVIEKARSGGGRPAPGGDDDAGPAPRARVGRAARRDRFAAAARGGARPRRRGARPRDRARRQPRHRPAAGLDQLGDDRSGLSAGATAGQTVIAPRSAVRPREVRDERQVDLGAGAAGVGAEGPVERGVAGPGRSEAGREAGRVQDRDAVEQVGAVLPGDRPVGAQRDVEHVDAGMVDGLEAVDERPARDRDPPAVLGHAGMALDEARRHRQVDVDDVARGPLARDRDVGPGHRRLADRVAVDRDRRCRAARVAG